MKKKVLIALAFVLSVHQAKSQFVSWEKIGGSFLYDFSGGRKASSPTVLSGADFTANHVDTSTTAKPGWLPAPVSGAAYLRIAQGTIPLPQNTRFDLDLVSNPKSLNVRVPAGGITSFSVAGITNATEIVRFSTVVNFGSVATIKDKALMRIAIGNHASTTFTVGSNLSTDPEANVFAALGFEYNAADRKVTLKVRRDKPSPNYTDVKTSYFNLSTDYLIEIIGNNSEVAQKYNYGTDTDIELASRTFHIYANGIKIDYSGNFDFPGAAVATSSPELAVNQAINAVRVWFLSGAADNAQNPTFTTRNIRFDYSESTLPVSLTSFMVAKQNNTIKLIWATASEKDNSHFDILRSFNGQDFTQINQITGAGDSSQPLSYSYTDYQPFSGVNYYKLKQVDFNGASTESEVKAVTIIDDKEEFTIYQGDNSLAASIYSNVPAKGSIKISDIAGSVVLRKNVALQAGYTGVNLAGENLKPGLYIANLTVEGKSKAVKFAYSQ